MHTHEHVNMHVQVHLHIQCTHQRTSSVNNTQLWTRTNSPCAMWGPTEHNVIPMHNWGMRHLRVWQIPVNGSASQLGNPLEITSETAYPTWPKSGKALTSTSQYETCWLPSVHTQGQRMLSARPMALSSLLWGSLPSDLELYWMLQAL